MNKKKIKNFDLESFLWSLVYLMPLLVIIARIFSNFHNYSNSISISDILNEFVSMVSFTNNSFISGLNDFVTSIFGLNSTLYVTCLINVVCYFILVKLLYLVYKFVTFIIDFVCKYFKEWSE